MSKKMKGKFDKYWGDPSKMNKVIFFVVIVDPRYKFEWVELVVRNMYGENEGISLGRNVKDAFVALFDDYNKPSLLEKSNEHIVSDVTIPSELDIEDPTFEVMMRMGSEYEQFHSRKRNDVSEVDKYLNEEIEGNDSKFDILGWWKVNEPRFPILSKGSS